MIGSTQFTARVNPRTTATAQSDVTLAFDLNKIHLFDKETELAILN
jgi:multiple sugar transport system ATP-binding protein